MAYDCTTGALSVAGTPATGSPMTIAGWFYPETTATGVLRTVCFVKGPDPNGHGNRLSWDSVNNTTNRLHAVATGANGTRQATAAQTFLPNTWVHGAAVFNSVSSRQAYLYGISGTTNTQTSGTQDTANAVVVGASFIGDVAEVGVWNVALTAAEIASLAKGVRCDSIRPQSLTFYAPLVRELHDIEGGLTLGNPSSIPVSDHPRIYG